MSDGMLIVQKPSGLTSHDVVEGVRRAYDVRAGHAGTLDPMAQGVLLIFMDRGLKILQYIPASALDKTYLMRVTLGRTTDTYDATGQTVSSFGAPVTSTNAEIVTALRKFVGSIEQRPPAFSAIKVGGRRAYDLARAGKPPELAARKVHVTSIRLVRDFMANEERHLVLRVHCSRGTYVRSIAHDLGQALGCGGHLSYLLRERVGAFSHLHAHPFWKVQQKIPFAGTSSFLPMGDVLPFARLIISSEAETKVRSGMPIDPRDISSLKAALAEPDGDPIFQVFAPDGQLLALYRSPGAGDAKDSREGKAPARLLPVRVLV